jgi:copper chaperone CopZ
MTTHQIFVENIKCGGCINSIKTTLLKKKGVIAVEIHKEADKVCVTGVAIEREDMVSQLLSLGYAVKGNNSLLSKAKSFVSCAAGNMSNK